MRISKIIILLIIIIFLNCTGYMKGGVFGMVDMVDQKNWKDIENTILLLLNTPKEKIVISPKQAISFDVITEIEYNNQISSNIDTLDSVIMFDKQDSVLSNYEVYKFYGEKNKKIKVEINSYFRTYAFGWSKFAMIPYIYLIDVTTQSIKQKGNRFTQQCLRN